MLLLLGHSSSEYVYIFTKNCFVAIILQWLSQTVRHPMYVQVRTVASWLTWFPIWNDSEMNFRHHHSTMVLVAVETYHWSVKDLIWWVPLWTEKQNHSTALNSYKYIIASIATYVLLGGNTGTYFLLRISMALAVFGGERTLRRWNRSLPQG